MLSQTACLLLTVLLSLAASERNTYVLSKLDQVIYVYPSDIKKDKDLTVCEPDSVCGVVNQRFWLPPFAQRFCQCPKSQCPFSWSDNHNRSVPLDNRSQLKTCEDTRNLMVCDRSTVALTVTETRDLSTGRHDKDVRLLCKCSWPAYWKLYMREANATVTYSEYICSQLGYCRSGQFCGHVRADTYSTYYQCACPRDHLCINHDKVQRNVTELLFHGKMMRAHCVPNHHPNSV
ncbi:Hypothetical protein NTJ_03575 [Nesidiocoris tenuis]|uniref:Uncharacterized protein n=1 Tax=Nesidiocoris tenuis TaxID=355587 RepID=A0ABN7AHK6_9HEMI|nr:Hypothetical protein NTJ_03575 [Nesidiocoris tenuis]